MSFSPIPAAGAGSGSGRSRFISDRIFVRSGARIAASIRREG